MERLVFYYYCIVKCKMYIYICMLFRLTVFEHGDDASDDRVMRC